MNATKLAGAAAVLFRRREVEKAKGIGAFVVVTVILLRSLVVVLLILRASFRLANEMDKYKQDMEAMPEEPSMDAYGKGKEQGALVRVSRDR